VSKRSIALFAALAALAMIVAGCGGDDDSTGTTGSLTKAEFVKQGNAICAKGNKELDEDFEKFAKEHNLSENKRPSNAVLTEASEDILIPVVSDQIEQLRDLGAPAGEEQQVDEILTAAEEGIEKGEEDPVSLTAENGGPFKKANKLAKDYGLTKCGEE
jgi:hypothetical protein